MKKLMLALLAIAVTCAAIPVAAWDPAKQKDLGQDESKMQWYLLDYGIKEGGAPFAIVRKYYTNPKIKSDTVDLLMAKYMINPEVASSLYFTEYEYEFSKDGKQFSMIYQRHCSMVGDEIYGTVFDDSTEGAKKTFNSVADSFAAGKSIAFAMPAPAPQKAPAKRAPARRTPARKG